MLLPDVNVLVCAHRADDPAHGFYRHWLKAQLDADAPIAVSQEVFVGFLRVVTNRRIYPVPTPLPVALAAVETLRRHPRVREVAAATDHVDRVVDLCRKVDGAGADVADAAHAAVAIANGCTWVTRDAGFGRFEPHGLRWMLLEPEGARRRR